MANRRKRSKKRPDPRTSEIVPQASPVTVRKADGTVEVKKAQTPTKQQNKPFPKVRPRKAM